MGSIPRTDFVLCGVKVDMGCMNLVTVISSYTRGPVTLIVQSISSPFEHCARVL